MTLKVIHHLTHFEFMPQYFVKGLGGTRVYQYGGPASNGDAIGWLKARIEEELGVPASLSHLRVSPWRIEGSASLDTFGVEVMIGLDGGKGGFGTLLRGGNTNRQGPVNNDSSRDLEGRRLRDATALSKIQRALDKKQAKLNGIELPESDEEEELTKGGKRKPKKKRQPRASSSNSTDPTEDELHKYEIKRRKEEAIRQTHRQVVEETTDAVLTGIAVSSEQNHATSATTSRGVSSMYGDIYDIESSEDEDDSGEESDDLSAESASTTKATSTTPDSSTKTEKAESSSAPIETVAVASVTKAVAVDLPERPGVKRSHETMESFSEIDLMKYDGIASLEALGLEKLKEELGKRGLMVGGNLAQRAARLFQVRGLTPDKYPPELLAKSKKPKT